MGGEAGLKVKATANGDVTLHPALPAAKPAIHIIVLGASGGPKENNVTALLVRSVASAWKRGSVIGVDAGVHLGAIEAILRETQPASLNTPTCPLPHTLLTGPFAGFTLPHPTAAQNALHFHQSVVEGFIITHPHLDHITGMVINTAASHGGRTKRVAGLPYTIATLKSDIFNNRIWPNLTDENNGAGLVTFSRLLDGGSPVLDETRGYLEICDGLLVKTFSVSHGSCIEAHPHRGSIDSPTFPDRRRSSAPTAADAAQPSLCVSESSASFLRDVATSREVLIFGDVEPDSLSLSPRNRRVWREAAPKIVERSLVAIAIECSFDDAQPEDSLFGHLTPRFLVQELAVLAGEVRALMPPAGGKGKRKRAGSEVVLGGGGGRGWGVWGLPGRRMFRRGR